MKNTKILVIEDEPDVQELIVAELKESGFEVHALADGNGALEEINKFHPDVILLDQRLPGKSGIDIVKEIRSSVQFSEIPIMMVTGVVGVDDKVKAFDIGADDYLTKPFMVTEVVARIKALIRRVETGHKKDQKQLTFKDLSIDFAAHKVFLAGNEIQLTLTEFKILAELIKQNGEVLSRDLLREKALGTLNVSDRTIDVHMASLRKKLEHLGDCIETVRGVGYRIF